MNTTRSTNNNLPIPASSSAPDRERHARKCEICHHEDREAIEEAFINWQYPDWLARHFKVLAGESAIYRHAHAMGLFELRRRRVRDAIELIIERAGVSSPNATNVLQAIAMHARLDGRSDVAVAHTLNVIVTRRWEPNAPAPDATQLPSNPPEPPADAAPIVSQPPQTAPRPESSEERIRRMFIESQKH